MKKKGYLNHKELKEIKFKFLGKNCKISRLASFVKPENISIMDNVRIDDFCLLVAFNGFIKIGKNTHIGGLSYIQGWAGVSIGLDCNISQAVKIYSKSDNYKTTKNLQIKKKVVISDNVIIGSGSVILPGAKLQSYSRIGALTVVNKLIKKKHLYFGQKLKKIS